MHSSSAVALVVIAALGAPVLSAPVAAPASHTLARRIFGFGKAAPAVPVEDYVGALEKLMTGGKKNVDEALKFHYNAVGGNAPKVLVGAGGIATNPVQYHAQQQVAARLAQIQPAHSLDGAKKAALLATAGLAGTAAVIGGTAGVLKTVQQGQDIRAHEEAKGQQSSGYNDDNIKKIAQNVVAAPYTAPQVYQSLLDNHANAGQLGIFTTEMNKNNIPYLPINQSGSAYYQPATPNYYQNSGYYYNAASVQAQPAAIVVGTTSGTLNAKRSVEDLD